MVIPEILEFNSREYASNTAVCFFANAELRTISHEQVHGMTLAVATLLTEKGYCGKNILLLGSNSLQWLICYYAIVGYVGVLVPIDTEWSSAEVMNISKKTECSLIIYSEGFEQKHEFIDRDKISMIDLFAGTDGTTCERSLQSKNDDELAVILFTSGTMSDPKGVEITQKNLFANSVILKKRFRMTSDQNLLAILPFHHIYAQNICIINPLYQWDEYFYM